MTDTTATHSIDRTNLDMEVNPADDFYTYACGGWQRKHPLTAEYSRFGTFDLLRENARTQLRELITGLGEDPEAKNPGTIAQKVSDIYALGMDADRLNREGAAPLTPLLRRVETADISTPAALASFVAELHEAPASPLFGTGVGTDYNDSDRHVMHIGEAGLGLGDRDYYLEHSDNNTRIMTAYETYVKRIMRLAGYGEDACRRVWDNLIRLETEFATHKLTREQRRDPKLRNNPVSFDQLCADYPAFDWSTYFDRLGTPAPERINVLSPQFMKALDEILPRLSEQQLRDYMAFEVVSGASGLLSDDFSEADFELYGRVMSGQEEQQPRWKRAMTIPNSMFGEAVGSLYVKKYFPERNKTAMTGLVENLRQALGKHIDSLEWMSDDTKAKAHEKLATFAVKIGYPDKWKDYSGISIDPERSYLDNVLAATRWYQHDNLEKLHKPVDKDEWLMTPQTVNAYYNPTTNEICFPAAILQPPYFDIDADDALNYGAIGVVIGHEMTHGFDDSGRQYDKSGNLAEWWRPDDAERFKVLADRLVAQFDAVEIAPGTHANGRYTLGENIADQGGLRIALTAYLDAVPAEKRIDIDGFTPLQRFYLSYANVWADNIRDEEKLLRTQTDPHSLGRNRVNVTLRNLDTFLEAFSIRPGDSMYRAVGDRVIIW